MTLHLVRLPLDLRALAAFAVANAASDDDGGYALHLALRCRFGAAGPQPFRFLPDMHADRGGPQLLGYAADPSALAEAAALPATDVLLGGVFGAPATQAMPAVWRAGARYRFEVRVRPVVRFGGRVREARRARPGAWLNKAGEIDAFLAACERAGPLEDGGVPVNCEGVYVDWLRGRMATAAALEDDVALRLLRRAATRRRKHAKPQVIDREAGSPPPRQQLRYGTTGGPDVVLGGTLSVTDPAAFGTLLARGVGRHTAFGFGMLLLSPPGRAG